MSSLRERLAQSVGGKAKLASNFSQRTMRDLDARAEREIEGGAQMIEEALDRVAKAITREGLEAFAEPTEEPVDKAIRAWAAYQHAGAQVANWMVTGPARFPVARNNKRIATEDRRLGELLEMLKLAPERFVKRARQKQREAIGPQGIVDAELADLKARLEKRELNQRMMKSVNEIIRREKLKEGDGAKLSELITLRGFPMNPNLCGSLLQPAWQGAPRGFASYSLSNNLAEIKRLQARVAEVERRAKAVEQAAPAAERVVAGVTVVEDPVDDRLRLLFEGKPEPDVISLLKSRGFKWSPRNTAWQRQLTNNARYAAEGVLKQIGEAA